MKIVSILGIFNFPCIANYINQSEDYNWTATNLTLTPSRLLS